MLQALQTANSVQLGARELRAGERASLPDDGQAIELLAGRTRLRLRRPGDSLARRSAAARLGHAAAPQRAHAAGRRRRRSPSPSRPGCTATRVFARSLGSAALAMVMGAAV